MKIRKLTAITLCCGVAFGSAVACSHENTPAMTPASGVAPRVSAQDAAGRLADTRCEHEQKCNNIGEDADYGTYNQCMDKMRQDAASKFSDCTNGVAESDLRVCRSQIEAASCSGVPSMVDQLSTYMKCRSLCLG